MSTALITPEFEIVPAEIGLDLVAKNSLELAFAGFFETAAKWRDQAAAITDPKLARTARLELKNLRVAAENKRKELKEDSLRMGKAIDGANNILLSIIVPIERGLEDIEKAEERRIAEELRQRAESRTAELRPFIDPALPFPAVGGMTEEQFQATLADAKLLHRMKQEAAAKAEAERIEREAEAARERLRISEENERLRKEAAEREAQMKAEREAAAEREAREKAEAEAKALRDAEARRIADEAKAQSIAAKAPDREKLIAFARTVRGLTPGAMKSAEANAIAEEIASQVEKFAVWVESKAAKL